MEDDDMSRFDYDDGDESPYICDRCGCGAEHITLDKQTRKWVCDDCVIGAIAVEVD